MAPPKKEFFNCPHCGRSLAADNSCDGFFLRRVAGGAAYQISCPCGVMSRLCMTKEMLQVVWNSRPNKPFIASVLQVTHPKPRGYKKGDTVLTKNGEVPF